MPRVFQLKHEEETKSLNSQKSYFVLRVYIVFVFECISALTKWQFEFARFQQWILDCLMISLESKAQVLYKKSATIWIMFQISTVKSVLQNFWRSSVSKKSKVRALLGTLTWYFEKFISSVIFLIFVTFKNTSNNQ